MSFISAVKYCYLQGKTTPKSVTLRENVPNLFLHNEEAVLISLKYSTVPCGLCVIPWNCWRPSDTVYFCWKDSFFFLFPPFSVIISHFIWDHYFFFSKSPIFLSPHVPSALLFSINSLQRVLKVELYTVLKCIMAMTIIMQVKWEMKNNGMLLHCKMMGHKSVVRNNGR